MGGLVGGLVVGAWVPLSAIAADVVDVVVDEPASSPMRPEITLAYADPAYRQFYDASDGARLACGALLLDAAEAVGDASETPLLPPRSLAPASHAHRHAVPCTARPLRTPAVRR